MYHVRNERRISMSNNAKSIGFLAAVTAVGSGILSSSAVLGIKAVGAQPSSGGRIAGRATDIPDIPPKAETRIERTAPRSSEGSGGTFSFEFGRPSRPKIPKVRIRDGDALDDADRVILRGRPLRKTDVALFGGVVGAAIAQNELRKRFDGSGGGESAVNLVTYQVALYDGHGLMRSLQRLAQRAETTTSAGLASLASNVCLELLRGYDGWVSSKATSKTFRDMAGAEKEFNEASFRERKKWAYENTAEDREAFLQDYSRAAKVTGGKHLMVLTLMVACRKIGGSKILPKRAGSAEALETCLEKFAAALLEKGGRNVIAVDVSWTPDDANDVLSRLELSSKWPDLIDF